MELFSIVLIVAIDQPSDYTTLRVTPMKMGFDWRGNAPRLRDAPDLPSLSLQISTTAYSDAVEQHHYDTCNIGNASDFVENVDKRVETAKRYNQLKMLFAEDGLENPVKALRSYLAAIQPDPNYGRLDRANGVIGLLRQLTGENEGNYEPISLPDVIDQYRRVANESYRKAQTRLEEKQRKNDRDEITRLKQLLDSYASGITKAE